MSSIMAKMRRTPRAKPEGGAVLSVVSFQAVQSLITGDGSAEDVRALLATASNKASLLSQREDGWTLFHTACNRGKLQSAHCLAEHGSDCNAVTPKGLTGLHFLALLGREECTPHALFVQLLSELVHQCGSSVHVVSSSNETCLHLAASRKNDVAAQFFIEQGCDIEALNKHGETALHVSVRHGALAIVSMLLVAGAATDVITFAGETPLDLATKGGSAEMVALLSDPPPPPAKSKGSGAAPAAKASDRVAALASPRDLERSGSFAGPAMDDRIIVGEAVDGAEPPPVMGCWDTYRNEFFGKKHYVYHCASDDGHFAGVVVLARPSSDGVYSGLLVKDCTWLQFTFSADQLLLYASIADESEQIAHLLASHKPTMVWPHPTWQPLRSALTVNGTHLLALEARLGLRPRICVGVVFGRANQRTEAEMFENTSGSAQFERFLNVLGERVEMSTWRAWKGTFAGSSERQIAYYAAWRGFEFVFHVSTLMDAAKQRQHIGNDTVVIYFKHGLEGPDRTFRGKVNACALVVQCAADEEDDDGNNDELQLSSFHRAWIEGFAAQLGTGLRLSEGARLREMLFSNAINVSYLASRSGPYRANRIRLFDQAVGELIAMESGASDKGAAGTAMGADKADKSATTGPTPSPRRGTPPSGGAISTAPSLTTSSSAVALPVTSAGSSASAPAAAAASASSSFAANAAAVAEETRKAGPDELRVGWLQKRRAKFTGKSVWKRRWVVLREDNLSYYEKDGDAPLGTIPLNSIRELELSSEPAAAGFAGGKKAQMWCLIINYHDGDRIEFSTSNASNNETELKAWMHAINARRPSSAVSPIPIDGRDVGGRTTPPPTPGRTMDRSNSNMNLTQLALDGEDDKMPDYLVAAMDVVVRRGVFLEGILRNAPDHSASDSLCSDWKRGQRPDLAAVDALAVGAAVRKHLTDFRFLSADQYKTFLAASKLDLPEEKLDAVMHIVRNSAVLTSLLDFLNRVYAERELNKATASNLAALFAPSFLRADQETPLSLIANTKALTAIVELLVRHCACCQLTNEEGWRWTHGGDDSEVSLPAHASSTTQLADDSPRGSNNSLVGSASNAVEDEDPFAEEPLTPVIQSKARSGRAIQVSGGPSLRGSGTNSIAEAIANSPKVPHEKAPEAPMLVVSGRGAKPIKRPTGATPARPPGPAPSPVKGRGRGTSSMTASGGLDELLALPSESAAATKASGATPPAAARKASASSASTVSLSSSGNNVARKNSATPAGGGGGAAAPIELDDDDWFT